MNLKSLLSTLQQISQQAPDKVFQVVLANGQFVPAHFHITEVGLVKKKFIDCGGQQREDCHLQIQLWIGEDHQHRLTAVKALRILELSDVILPDELERESLPVVFEYQTEVTALYPLRAIEVTDQAVQLMTAILPTQCLAQVSEEGCSVNSCCG